MVRYWNTLKPEKISKWQTIFFRQLFQEYTLAEALFLHVSSLFSNKQPLASRTKTRIRTIFRHARLTGRMFLASTHLCSTNYRSSHR